MFGVYSAADDDENDYESIPISNQYFNPTVRPRSKLGRRKLIQTKGSNNAEPPKQDTQPLPKPSSKDDSGIFPSESTPSLTHPVSRTGNANFNARLGSFTSTFTPSLPHNRENKFNKFVLPSTPRYRSEPLKEINAVDNALNQVGNAAPISNFENSLSEVRPQKDPQETAIQKQLNSSFIDESLPSGSGAGNKTPNDTSDFSNDSFMTCTDIPHPNKTVYDPVFLKTPGRNLAEIRIDDSPFNPLQNFLEESDDGSRVTPVKRKTKADGPNESVNATCSQNTNSERTIGSFNRERSHSASRVQPVVDQFAQTTVDERLKCGSRERAYSASRAHTTDDDFKHPSLALLKTPLRTDIDRKGEMREHTTPSSGYASEKSFHSEETTHVTYPQSSKTNLGQKNTFTSQFSLNSGISSSINMLSLNSQGYEPMSAASLQNGYGMRSHFNQGHKPQNGRIVHRMGNSRDCKADQVFAQSSAQSLHESAQEDTGNTCSSGLSERTVVVRNGREPGPESGQNEVDSKRDDDTSLHNDHTVVERKPHLAHYQEQQQERIQPQQLQNRQCDSNPPERRYPPVEQITAQQRNQGRVQCPPPSKVQSDIRQDPVKPQFGGPSGSQPQTKPHPATQLQSNNPSDNPVLSALIKPQPQNVITIKGTPYTVLSLLGKGGSSQVYQALGPQSSKLMAIKCVNLASVEEAIATDYLNEIALLSKLQGCPSVIKMFDHEYVEQSQMLYVVLEKGDIDFSKLIKNISENNQISMPMILYYWSEMLNAVHEIHQRGIIHSDLKPANFLLVEGRLKLIDFGIASSITGDTTSVMKDVPAGTYNYMSPESITGPKITRKSDVWSMGCILFNLLYGRTPFSHLNNRWQKLHAIADVNHPVTFPPLKHHAPPSLRLALRWSLNKDPSLRPTVEELVILSELSPPPDSGLGKEIDGMMCQYFRRVLPNLRNLKEDS